jgi:ribosomal protein S27AE
MAVVAKTDKMICQQCKVEMNHHCDKLVYSAGADEAGNDPGLGGIVEEFHTCPNCGDGSSRHA